MAGLTEEERIRFMGDTTGLTEEEKLNLETAARVYADCEIPGYVTDLSRGRYHEDHIAYTPIQKKWFLKPGAPVEDFEFWMSLEEREVSKYKMRKFELKFSVAQGNKVAQLLRVHHVWKNGQPQTCWMGECFKFNDKHQVSEDCTFEENTTTGDAEIDPTM